MARDLSPQEKEVLRLIGKGRTTDQIARRLGIAESTVVWYVSRAVTRYGPRQTEQIAVSLARAPRRRALALVTATLVALVLAGAVLASTVLGGVPMLQPLAPLGSQSPSPSGATPTPRSQVLPDAPATRDEPASTPNALPSTSPPPSSPAPALGTTAPLIAPAAPLPVPPSTSLPLATPQPLPTIALPTVPLPSAPLATPGIPRIP